ncbi:excinuclease ABC subunit UvrB [archaeon]|nr:excinuclease ABC subunit UvrB [archaeon]MBT6698596.1 excinuclease ABC subunit UvrB [archaeon]
MLCMPKFKLHSKFKPAGGQPAAIKKLIAGYKKFPMQTLQGITGSGKTFIMANLIENVQQPTLILAHNKTLAAQLYQELKAFFPENRVEYFISYYDYYQPESYLPTTDTYIEKDSSINEEIGRMRLKTTASLLARKDVIVVSSISCIYGLGDPKEFRDLSLTFTKGEKKSRLQIIKSLVQMQYTRTMGDMEPGKFRVKGETFEIWPAYDDEIIRVELFGDETDAITLRHKVTGTIISKVDEISIFPAKQFVVSEDKVVGAIEDIKDELHDWAPKLQELERQRIKQRTKYDLEMIKEMGYCSGIENYSRHFEGRKEGTPPFTLLDYFPKDFMFIIDESHQSIPQSHAMYKGDLARKKNLIDFGFRLPCAYDNRPLKFAEFEKYFTNTIFVSATPAAYEIEKSGQVVEQIIRPTGLLDPTIEIKPIDGQIKDIIEQIRLRVGKKVPERVLVTTLTKRMAEDLTNYLAKADIRVRYMHSDIESLDRIELIRALRAGEFDVLVGINLLREGLDLPEVSLVTILDADKEGFLRNERSLIQTIGRAARNANGHVILYADKITKSIKAAVGLTRDRRKKQMAYNKKYGIVPKTIIKKIPDKTREIKGIKHLPLADLKKQIKEVNVRMRMAAEELNFEVAIDLRGVLKQLEDALEQQEGKGKEKKYFEKLPDNPNDKKTRGKMKFKDSNKSSVAKKVKVVRKKK